MEEDQMSLPQPQGEPMFERSRLEVIYEGL